MAKNNLTKDEKKLVARLGALEIEQPSDLLLFPPIQYMDYRQPQMINKCLDGKGYFKLTVSTFPRLFQNNGGTPRTVFSVSDGRNNAEVCIFGQAFDFKDLKVGETIHCRAEVKTWNGKLQLGNPEIVPESQRGRVVPVYKGKPKVVTPATVYQRVQKAFPLYQQQAVERILEATGESEEDLLSISGVRAGSLKHWLERLHQPKTMEEAENALEDAARIAAYQVYCMAKQREEIHDPNCNLGISYDTVRELIEHIPFQMTRDQRRTVKEIIDDLNKEKPMKRLLSGDVGVGKTIAYLVPAVAAQKSGRRVAIMIPSTLVAQQVTKELGEYWPEVPVRLLEGGSSAKRKKQPLDLSDNPVLIGTSALIFALEKQEHHLDFLIVDEQHKMGREQREILKASHTHVLEATATAIPRTMAIISHGGMDISIIREKPVVKNIKTAVVEEKHRGKVFEEIRRVIEAGRQVAIIYPVVEKKEDPNGEDENLIDGEAPAQETNEKLTEVVEAGKLMEKSFPGRVCVLHGKMKQDEKSETMREMKAGKYDILVASSVIEIGVTVPSMMMVLVIDADRYGATTLHQLRGRIDRKGEITAEGGRGLFLMMVRRKMNEKIQNRLNILVNHDDGFDIAEEDMRQRGFGDISASGTRQSGSTNSVLINVKVTPERLAEMFERFDGEERKAAEKTTQAA